jgi:cell division protein FtsL
MSSEQSDVKPRSRRRWTLGGLMVLVAVAALPLTWYVHQVRELNRQRAVADMQRAKLEAQINYQVKLVIEQHNWLRSEVRARTQASFENSTTGGAPPSAETVEQPR